MYNIFDHAGKYIKKITGIKLPIDKLQKFEGYGIAVVWLTKFCAANCKHCFSRSNMVRRNSIEQMYEFSETGIDKLIQFINSAKISYLLLSGGGEPMLCMKAIAKIIQNAQVNKIVIATSGIWASSHEKTEQILDKLYLYFCKRSKKISVTIRISVDEYHEHGIPLDYILNIINVFRTKYRKENDFLLMIHTLQNDITVEKVTQRIKDSKITFKDTKLESDSPEVLKVIPRSGTLILKDYSIKIGYAKLFYPDLLVNMNKRTKTSKKAIDVFNLDMNESEEGNPSTVRNMDGTFGIDFWIDTNGNVTTWGNQLQDNIYNIYTDNYQKVIYGTLQNIYSYSFLEKGYWYREKIVEEVNTKAIERAKLSNLRNYTSILLLREDKTKLYLGIRLLQDYYTEGILTDEDISTLPSKLVKILSLSDSKIKSLYADSNLDIVHQEMLRKSEMIQTDWQILFKLIQQGHFEYDKKHLEEALTYYNNKYNTQYINIDELQITDDILFYETVKERLFPMKEEARLLFENKTLLSEEKINAVM